MAYETLQIFLPAIQKLCTDRVLTKEDLLTESFLMKKEPAIRMYYAPHNDYVNHKAKIIIVGITPGWHQMKTAFRHFTRSFNLHNNPELGLYSAKIAARFAGTMRKNLLDMLDQCHIPDILNIPCASYLFAENNNLLHTTSIIKYPVFVNGKNYTGHQPQVEHSPLLKHYAYHAFPKEINTIDPPALVIPLGKSVERTILKLIQTNKLSHHHYLFGFPHPSGANGHRYKQFNQKKEQLRETINKWAVDAF